MRWEDSQWAGMMFRIIIVKDKYRMNNANSRSRVEDTRNIAQQEPSHLQYVNEYDTYGYQQSPITPATHYVPLIAGYYMPPSSREAYHINSTVISNPYPNTNIANSRVKSQSSRLVASQVKNEQVVKGESRVSYVPYEKKVIEYQDRTYVEKVPVKRKVVTYEQRKEVVTVPHEVIKQDFYAVEKRIQYYKEVIPQKKIEMVPVQRKIKRYEYVPVEKQIVHYPENVDIQTAKGQSRVVLQSQGVQVRPDAEFRPINPALIYSYSARPESKYNPIGYVDQGQSRVFSNSPTFMPPLQHEYYQPQSQQQLSRSFSAQKFETSHVFSPRLQGAQEGESYIKELSNLGKGQLKRPFELLEQSTAKTQPGSYPHLQRVTAQQRSYLQQNAANHPQSYQQEPFNDN